MRFSRLFIPTLKETPTDAEVVSHKYMLRSGMIRKVASGIYSFLPVGLMCLRKVESIIREEMDAAGAQEVLLPSVQPCELWIETGRWNLMGEELLRFKDRHGRDFCYGPTHEEIITDLVRREVRSWRDLPFILYQIQTKFRDEIRPRFGLMRGREFGMKDAYSFDLDEEGAEKSYWKMYTTYKKIFERMDLNVRPVEADTGTIGGAFSHEFMVLAESGEDAILYCTGCDYAANVEKAEILSESPLPPIPSTASTEERQPELIPTKGKKTVEDVATYLAITPRQIIKTLIYRTEHKDIAVLVRGDREANERKIRQALSCQELRLATQEEVKHIVGVEAGSIGPVRLSLTILADQEIARLRDAVVGANIDDHHLIHVYPGRDFNVDLYADLRFADTGDPCPRCGTAMKKQRGIEVGHIFMLGTKYSEALRATYLDRNGKERLICMGCYGIGTGRTLAAAIEQNHDEHGIVFPMPLAPFLVIVTPVNVHDSALFRASETIYEQLRLKGIPVLLDDRDERAGSKFKDADLIGIPIRITVGPKGLAQGAVDVKLRWKTSGDLVPLSDAVARVESLISSFHCEHRT